MYSPNSKYFQIPEVEIIRPARKTLPYTVIPIGDKAALLQWRAEQKMLAESRETRLKPIREARRATAIDMIQNQNAPIKLTEQDKAELAHRKARTETPKSSPVTTQYVMEEPIKPSIAERLKGAIASLWRSAFPE